MATSSISTTVTPAKNLDPAVQKALDDIGFTPRKNSTNLSSDDFLKLLTVQLQNQDPLKPMEDAQFMGQMAQFASLEQTKELNSSFSDFTKSFSKQQAMVSATQFIGMEVTLNQNDAKGVPISGVVSQVMVDADGPKIVVNGTAYATDAVTLVKPPTLSK